MLSKRMVSGTPPIASKLSTKKESNTLCDFDMDNIYVLKREYDNKNTPTFTYNISPSFVRYFIFSFQSTCTCFSCVVYIRTTFFLSSFLLFASHIICYL